jgi:hypothetical protein
MVSSLQAHLTDLHQSRTGNLKVLFISISPFWIADGKKRDSEQNASNFSLNSDIFNKVIST